ncbi:MAG: peptidyl-tRNA hydrolase Pth2, partial [Candidatus Ranarchaeia archaeon]
NNFRYKQVIVTRKDLKLSKGKFACQVAHAAVFAANETRIKHQKWWKNWYNEGQKKVILKVENLEEMYQIQVETKLKGISAVIIRDAGLTEIDPGTVTVLGIGPAPSNLIDELTGHLKLV